ncbi:MAG: glyoxalase superfamily protein [Rhodobacteraceae bacterium]|nr:glyoxalase superfamily protein [Paracoccaceae bacterium]
MTRSLPKLAEAKELAKTLRTQRESEGQKLGHAQALEQDHGFRDLNAMHAAITAAGQVGWQVGDHATGKYLGQPFAATVKSSEARGSGWFNVVLDLDEAVDAVRFESFSNLRKQIRVELGPKEFSREQTSDGSPHVQIDL